ncbi:MAG: CapA family protein [Thomasclavelia sp.]|nr:CapA family protein [Thomasclavelia sp.]
MKYKFKNINKKSLLIVIIAVLVISSCSIILYKTFNSSDKTTTSVKKKKEKKDTVSFLAVGDNVIHQNVYEYADKQAGTSGDGKYDFTSCYKNIKSDIKKADISYICQETILGGDDKGASGYPAFNSPSVLASNLKTVGFDVVSSATNHAMDEDVDGVLNNNNTFNSVKGLTHIGTYSSNEDRNNIRVINKNGIRIAFLAYTFGVNQYTNYSHIQAQMQAYPYLIPVLDENTVKTEVANAKKVSDVVVVATHWGVENDRNLNSLQTHYADILTECGVDLVVGSHPHLVETMEYKTSSTGHKTLVIYSLGNVISTMKEVDTQLEMMFTCDFVKNKDKTISIENIKVTPLINHYNGNNLCTVYKYSQCTNKLASSSSVLHTQTDVKKYFKTVMENTIPSQFKKVYK